MKWETAHHSRKPEGYDSGWGWGWGRWAQQVQRMEAGTPRCVGTHWRGHQLGGTLAWHRAQVPQDEERSSLLPHLLMSRWPVTGKSRSLPHVWWPRSGPGGCGR